MSHYVYRNLQATKISKLQLTIALYIIYIRLIVFTLSSLQLGHFMTKKTDMTQFCSMVYK